MRRRSGSLEPLFTLLLAALMIPLLAHSGSGQPAKEGQLTAADILAKVKAATGGAVWDAMKTRHDVMAAKTSGLEGTLEAWADVQTGKGAVHFALGPLSGAEGWDGTTVWSQDPSGQPKPEEGDDAILGQMNEAYLRALAYWYPARWPADLSYQGAQEEKGRRFHVLSITPQKGRVFTLWVDAQTWTFDRMVEKTAMETRTTMFSEYRESNGVRIPFALQVTNGESKYDQFFTVQTVEWNVPVSDAQFAMPAPPATDYRFADGKTQTTVPFQLINNHIYVDVRLNGKGPYRFLCDTGGQNVITPTVAKELGVESQGAIQGRGVGEKSEDVGLTKIEALSVGDVTVDNQVFAVYPLEPFSNVEGVPQYGLIGYEVFKRFVVKIDYEANQLTLTDPKAFAYAGSGTAVPFKFEDSIPQVDGSIDGLPGVFSIDTGSRVSLSLTGPFADKNGLRKKTPSVEAMTGWGVGGPARGTVIRMHDLRLGSLAIQDVVTDMSIGTKGALSNPYVAGNVGGGVLKRFNLTFDYGKQQILFEPNAHRNDPDLYDRSGMWVNIDGKDFVVMDVTAGGAAQKAGLRTGDHIVAVDGTPPETIGLVALRGRFRSEPAGTHIRVRLQRLGKAKDVDLVLKDLI
jgi:predicted aspartyl protease